MLKIADYSRLITELQEKANTAFAKANIQQKEATRSADSIIRIVFVGQYSAGKSSMLKMLTGREDIKIGAGITTQKVETYLWNGIEVTDTPGIHSELRPDHDAISYQAIADADMLVFVITNELFDAKIAEHFRKLAIDKDKAAEMILAVNKMERTADGNTPEQQMVILDDLKKVVEPYTPEQLHICFLDAESYLQSLEERDSDPEMADELYERSGCKEFIATLNQFAIEKEISAKLTTGLYVLDQQLEDAIHAMEPKSTDEDMNALEENYLQQRHVFFTSQLQIQQEVRDIFSTAAAQIREIGLDAANLIIDGCSQNEVETELENAVRNTEKIIDKCQQEALSLVETRLHEMGRTLEKIENEQFTQNLKTRLHNKSSVLPENIRKLLENAGSGLKGAGKQVVMNTYKSGVSSGMRLTNFSGSTVHEIVLKAGHSIGYKFQPWQAVKITKGIAIGGNVLGVLGVGLDIFMQIKSDRDEEKHENILRNNRMNMRSQFNVAASELENFGNTFIDKYIVQTLGSSIAEIDHNIQEIRNTRENRSSSCREFEALKHECQNLIFEIHQM